MQSIIMVAEVNLKKMMKDVGKSFHLSFSDLQQIILNFHDEMRRGLDGEPSSLMMLPAFIDCPVGNEEGLFIALDLGGTNFRVLQVWLEGKGKVTVKQIGKYIIPRDVISGTGVELFDFIAQSIQQFLVNHPINRKKKITLGFTFSFPINQIDINSGILINWTKGFSASGVVGRDVVGMLSEALHRSKINNIDIVALANDTVGTLIAKAYDTYDCDVGVIFGTGTNACYRESTAAILKISAREKMSDYMIVNIEWGNFNCLPVNQYDRKLDKSSTNPGSQRMEKMISGMYLGELARLIIMDLIQNKAIFTQSSVRFAPGGMTTQDISAIENDRTSELIQVDACLKKVGIAEASMGERRFVQQICRHVSRRAARISAAAISAVVTWIDSGLNQHHTIAIDGTLYTKYPKFKQTILKTLNTLHGDKSKRIKLAIAKDGSGMGVAIASAVAVKLSR